MPEREICSPVTRKGSKVGSGQPMSPGARSDPGRRDAAVDSVPPQPTHARTTTHQEQPIPTSSRVVTGPEG
jgi:hypothetical protein